MIKKTKQGYVVISPNGTKSDPFATRNEAAMELTRLEYASRKKKRSLGDEIKHYREQGIRRPK